MVDHYPKKCGRCGVSIISLQHPHHDPTHKSNRALAAMGPQWTCGCSTWGPDNGSTLNPFELDSVP